MRLAKPALGWSNGDWTAVDTHLFEKYLLDLTQRRRDGSFAHGVAHHHGPGIDRRVVGEGAGIAGLADAAANGHPFHAVPHGAPEVEQRLSRQPAIRGAEAGQRVLEGRRVQRQAPAGRERGPARRAGRRWLLLVAGITAAPCCWGRDGRCRGGRPAGRGRDRRRRWRPRAEGGRGGLSYELSRPVDGLHVPVCSRSHPGHRGLTLGRGQGRAQAGTPGETYYYCCPGIGIIAPPARLLCTDPREQRLVKDSHRHWTLPVSQSIASHN